MFELQKKHAKTSGKILKCITSYTHHTIDCPSTLFLAEPQHLKGATHFLTIYNAIQQCPLKSSNRKEDAWLRMKSEEKLTSATLFFYSIFLKDVLKNVTFVMLKFQHVAHITLAFLSNIFFFSASKSRSKDPSAHVQHLHI